MSRKRKKQRRTTTKVEQPKNTARPAAPAGSLSKPVFWQIVFAFLLLLASGAGAIALLLQLPSQPTPGPERTDTTAATVQEPEEPAVDPWEQERRRRERFYQQVVRPELAELGRRNEDAALRCIQRVRNSIQGYRNRVPDFVDDLLSWSTRLGVLWRVPADWWDGDDRAKRYIQQKFEQHLFSEGELRRAVAAAVQAYRAELRGNMNDFLIAVKTRAQELAIPLPDMDSLAQATFEEAMGVAKDHAVDSATGAVLVFIFSEAASYAAAQLVTLLLAQAGRRVAAAGLTALGATGATTTAGAVAGPAGLLVGFFVGVAVDWWLTERQRQDLSRKLYQLLEELEYGLIEGRRGRAGLAGSLEWANQYIVEGAGAVMERALFQQLGPSRRGENARES